jgi:hypothetical protein
MNPPPAQQQRASQLSVSQELVRIQREAAYFDLSRLQHYAHAHAAHYWPPHQHWPAFLEEVRRFLVLKAVHRDCDASQLSPSHCIDQAWHCLLLSPVHYALMCDRLLPGDAPMRLLDHNPMGGEGGDAAAQRQRYARSLAAYRRVFAAEPPAMFWPSMEEADTDDFDDFDFVGQRSDDVGAGHGVDRQRLERALQVLASFEEVW